MLRFVLSGSLLVLALPAATAHANTPAWCAKVPQKITGANVADAINSDEPRYVADLVGALCFPDDEAKQRRRELDGSYKKWSKRLDLTDADWADVAEWTGAASSDRFNEAFFVDDKGTRNGVAGPIRRAWTSLGAIDQYAAVKSGMSADNGNPHDWNYFVDALGPKLTETARLAYVEKCIGERDVVLAAMCQGDIDALDRKKVTAELRADRSYTGYERMLIRFGMDRLGASLAAHAKEVDTWKKKDPAYAKMFVVAAAARKDWETKAAANAWLLELVAQMDDARATSSKKAFEGCEAKTWAAFKAGMATIAAKEFGALPTDEVPSTFLTGAIGIAGNSFPAYNAAIALYMCHRGIKKQDLLIDTIGGALQRWPGYRGPRSAAFTAILTAGLELDDTSSKIQFPSLVRVWLTGSSSGGNMGTIAKIAKDGETATIQFAPKFAKQEQCAQSRSTGRLVQITAGGTFVYGSVCLKYKTVTVNNAPRPAKVPVRYVEALKPGMNVMAGDIVLAAWNKGTKAPAVVAGAAVK